MANDEVPDLQIAQIEPGVYLHKSFSMTNEFGLVSANGLVVVEDDQAFIIDTPWSESDTIKLVTWLQDKNFTVLGSISTHSHEDRTAGIRWLNEQSISTYASALTNKLLNKKGNETAEFSFEEDTLVLANGLLEAYYPGGGHAIDNLVVWLPKSGILFGGCFIRSLASNSLGYTGEASLTTWPAAVVNVQHRYPKARLVVPGHGKAGGPELLEHTRMLAESASQ